MLKNKSDSLTKKKLGKVINSKFGLPTSYSETFVVDLFANITEMLILQKIVKLKNFGTFNLLFKKERFGRNPKNQKIYKIKERFVVTFKPSTLLKKIINRPKDV